MLTLPTQTDKPSSLTEPVIIHLAEIQLVGMRTILSFAKNTTPDLWRQFMPRRKELGIPEDTCYYSVALYPEAFFTEGTLETTFEKWACLEVSHRQPVPEGMQQLCIPEGRYAVFTYRGAASAVAPAFQYILNHWLPASQYMLDKRPHFERLDDRYQHEHPESQEIIYIPVRLKENR